MTAAAHSPGATTTPAGPDVSVVIPMFNAGGTLPRAVASVRDQRGPSWELIVVDDGSTDGSGAAARSLLAGDARCRLIHRANGGLSAARNTGLAHARGRWVLFLDADDLLAPHALARLVAAARIAGLPAAHGGFQVVCPSGRVLLSHHDRRAVLGLGDHLSMCFVVTHGLIHERAVLSALPRPVGSGGPFDERLPCVEDTDCWLRLAEAGVRWARVPAQADGSSPPVAIYTVGGAGAISSRFAAMAEGARRVFRAAYARSRAAPPEGAPDLSEAALAGVLGHSAWVFATRAAIAGPDELAHDSLATAGEIIARARADGAPPTGLSPGRAAGCAVHAVVFARGIDPGDPGTQDQWVDRITAWWSMAEAHAWLPEGGAALALAELWRRLPGPARGAPRVGAAA